MLLVLLISNGIAEKKLAILVFLYHREFVKTSIELSSKMIQRLLAHLTVLQNGWVALLTKVLKIEMSSMYLT